ncbi:hypothetical protein HEBU111660_00500 [Helicobacter burdigaliensis]
MQENFKDVKQKVYLCSFADTRLGISVHRFK